VVICLERGADLHMTQLLPLPLTVSLASVKSRLVLPFSYRLTRVVLEKGPLNVRVCVCCCILLCRDTLPEESEFELEMAEAGLWAPSVMATEYPLATQTPHSATQMSNRRRASIASRPARPSATLDRMKSFIMVRSLYTCSHTAKNWSLILVSQNRYKRCNTFSTHTHTHTCIRLTPFFRDYPGEPVPER